MKKEGKIKETTLCFVFDKQQTNGHLLMIQKKRGQGAGKWNVPGGKLLPGEDSPLAAIRETKEETGIEPMSLQKIGILEFYFPESTSWDNICTVYMTDDFSGELQPETDECSAHWIPLSQIPYDKMWDDDKLWIPTLLQGKFFHRVYTFDANDHMKEEKVIV